MINYFNWAPNISWNAKWPSHYWKLVNWEYLSNPFHRSNSAYQTTCHTDPVCSEAGNSTKLLVVIPHISLLLIFSLLSWSHLIINLGRARFYWNEPFEKKLLFEYRFSTGRHSDWRFLWIIATNFQIRREETPQHLSCDWNWIFLLSLEWKWQKWNGLQPAIVNRSFSIVFVLDSYSCRLIISCYDLLNPQIFSFDCWKPCEKQVLIPSTFSSE